MTKTQTRAILKGAGGTTEKSANLGNVGKIFVLRFYEPRKSKDRVIRARHIGFSWLFFFAKKIAQRYHTVNWAKKILKWSSERGLPLPPRSATQGSLSVSQKDEVVNKALL